MSKQLYGIIGHPVKHSLSPAMQNAAFKECGIDAEYGLYEVRPEELAGFLNDAPKKLSGLNVTIPHKIAAKDFVEKCGSLDDNARRFGAINTILVQGESLKGFNTDGPGFYRSLAEDLKFNVAGKNILILGAGGAGQAIAMYLGKEPKHIYVTEIDSQKFDNLKERFDKFYDSRTISPAAGDALPEIMKGVDLVINATPLGMKEGDALPIDAGLLRPGLYLYDLVYNAPCTRLVKEAHKVKAHAVTGIGMLLYQGAIAFELWTGKKAPVSVMRKALTEALKGYATS